MGNAEEIIIKALKSHGELSTSQLAALVAADDFARINTDLQQQDFSDPKKQRDAKRKKAQVHRRILYYLAKLQAEKILRISGQGYKGEKKYILDLDHDQDVIIGKRYHKTTQGTTALPPLPIDHYEEQHVVKKFASDTFIDQVNALLFNAQGFVSLAELEQAIDKFLPTVNDAVCIHNFEYFFADHPPSAILSTLLALQLKCTDFDKRISLIIDPERAAAAHLLPIITKYLDARWDKLTFVFSIAPERLFRNPLIEELCAQYLQHMHPFYVVNKRILAGPAFMGRAGAYSFTNEEWERYEREGQSKVIVVGQSAIIIDMHKYHLEYGKDPHKLEEFMRKIMHAFLISNTAQRRRSAEVFQYPLDLNRDEITDLFAYAKNYVRFWNYGWKTDGINNSAVVALLRKLKESVDRFTKLERTIYLSCGMPMRFTISFASAATSAAYGLTPQKFKTLYINDSSDFESDELRGVLSTKEDIVHCFDGGDIITLNQTRAKTVREIMLEVGHMLTHTAVPFLRYDFERIKEKHVALSAFLKA